MLTKPAAFPSIRGAVVKTRATTRASPKSRSPAEKTGLSAQAEAALSKVSETAQQAGNHVKEAATSLATEAGEKAKGFIDQQVASGADFLGYIGRSARVAAMGQSALAI